jgi:excisionase family DNA binding protein
MTRTLTLEQAADVLKTTPETVSEAIHNGGLPAARIGRAYVLVEEDVIAWLRTQYGKWRRECGSISAANEVSGGLTSRSTASELSAALAPRTSAKRRNTPRPLRAISGGISASAKPRE